jgi:enoyl-CoA hydratase/carnithine racemase
MAGGTAGSSRQLRYEASDGRIGLVPDSGSTRLLPRLVGQGIAGRTADQEEGIAASVEKRPPSFRGE